MRRSHVAFATALCTLIAAPAALAAGEPKNQSPSVNHDTGFSALAVTPLHAALITAVAAEPKNVTPFLRLSLVPKHR